MLYFLLDAQSNLNILKAARKETFGNFFSSTFYIFLDGIIIWNSSSITKVYKRLCGSGSGRNHNFLVRSDLDPDPD
jgi:hypothetical protein